MQPSTRPARVPADMATYTSQLEKLFIPPTATVRQAADRINDSRKALAALVVDGDCKLLDIITDGDIRRAVLAGLSLDTPVSVIKTLKARGPFRAPMVASATLPRAELLAYMRERHVQQIPLVDSSGRIVDLVTLSDLLQAGVIEVQAVVMAGGFGTRLQPLTSDMPKPMLRVGDKPLLELTIEQLKLAGIRQLNVTTHFQPEKIKQHFGDGREFGVNIEYQNEDTPLGTAGALAMIEESDVPLLVINGDILTRIDYRAMVEFHTENRAELTVAVRQYAIEVPYGVLECDGPVVKAVSEKPTYTHLVSAGIYLLQPSACKLVPRGVHFDMPDLINKLIELKSTVVSFPIVEYWLDIGQHMDYAQAQKDVESGRYKK